MKKRSAAKAQVSDTTRERILAAALAVFAERGFDGARTRDIAERAGANLGLIKYYFNDKQRLWKAAVTRAFTELQSGFAALTPPGEGESESAWLDGALRQFVRYLARHPEFMRLMNDEAKRDSPRMRWLADRFVAPLSDTVAVHLERARAQGLLAPIPAVSLRYIVLGAAGLVFSQAAECRYLTGVDPTTPEFAEQHADAIVALLIGGARAPQRKSRKPGSPRSRGVR